ncbi:unnamed protein product [Eruca vesicaria subsp. sativa]|uniref:Zinc finger GRF-type domain-containing protein n=1 Tax=Eruca vesicaria subsp. sativa TaxID=29727 RepID=A0ABC8KEP1_ERUVS|nr:unnamed protein product [Eruca vesicaria subsp. sativa]
MTRRLNSIFVFFQSVSLHSKPEVDEFRVYTSPVNMCQIEISKLVSAEYSRRNDKVTSSSSSSNAIKNLGGGPLCQCSRQTNVTLSWSDDNPGRRFHRCEVPGFVSWADTEEPKNWQKASLLEERNRIRCNKRETAALRATLTETNAILESLRSSAGRNEDLEIHQSYEQIFEVFRTTKKTMRTTFMITWVMFQPQPL